MRRSYTISTAEIESARLRGAAMGAELGVDVAVDALADHRWTSADHGRTVLHVEDFSRIPFLDEIVGIEEYQHRARIRARTGDHFVGLTPLAEGYDEYCRDVLGLGAPEFMLVEPIFGPLRIADACRESEIRGRLVELTQDAGKLVIHPYMSAEPVWELAAALARDSGAAVKVVGPPPPVTWVANDKNLLSELVRRTAGADFILDTCIETTLEDLTARVVRMSGHHMKVGVKRTRCASAMGNLVIDSDAIRRMGPLELRGVIDRFLTRTQWDGEEDVLVVHWADTDLSPSTQLWIPPLDDGPPIVDGVYEQILEGPEKMFVGSQPSRLPEPVDRAMAEASLRVAAGLQAMGYVGRCSFDFIVEGDPHDQFHARFTECNGRWGGTSTPMHLVDRLFPDGRPHYVAQDWVHPGMVGCTLLELLKLLEPALYDVRTGRGRFALYNVGPLVDKGKFDIVSIGEPAEALDGIHEVLPRLLGLS